MTEIVGDLLLTKTKEGIEEREKVAFGVEVDTGPSLSMISISSQTLLKPDLTQVYLGDVVSISQFPSAHNHH